MCLRQEYSARMLPCEQKRNSLCKQKWTAWSSHHAGLARRSLPETQKSQECAQTWTTSLLEFRRLARPLRPVFKRIPVDDVEAAWVDDQPDMLARCRRHRTLAPPEGDAAPARHPSLLVTGHKEIPKHRQRRGPVQRLAQGAAVPVQRPPRRPAATAASVLRRASAETRSCHRDDSAPRTSLTPCLQRRTNTLLYNLNRSFPSCIGNRSSRGQSLASRFCRFRFRRQSKRRTAYRFPSPPNQREKGGYTCMR